MLGQGDINPWFPEQDVVAHQALGKLLEEIGELGKIAARCLIQGVSEHDPVSGLANRDELLKELADVRAAGIWVEQVLLALPGGMNDRVRTKLAGFQRWQAMLETEER